MISKEEIKSNKLFNFELIKKWFIEDVDSYKQPYKLITKLKQLQNLFKINQDLIQNLIIENQGLKLFKDKFINGFDNWHETHFEVVQEITKQDFYKHDSETIRIEYDIYGSAGMYDLARELTDKFELKYKGKQWGIDDDTQYFDALEEFFKEELYDSE